MADKLNKPWSQVWVIGATFLFGPGATVFLIWRNLIAIGKKEYAKKFLILGLLSLLVLVIGIIYIPPNAVLYSITAYIPRAVGVGAILYFYLWLKQQGVTEMRGFSWSLLGWSILGFLVTILLFLLVAVAEPYFKKQLPFQFESDQAYLESYCKEFNLTDNESIKDSHFYVPEDATCFIHADLNTYRLDEISEVINLSGDLEREKGIAKSKVPGLVESIEDSTTHNTEEYIQYVYDKKKSGLTKDQIEEILEAEINYMKLIGIID